MISYPNAKINLGLNVVEKRSDGFHNIETLFVPYFGLADVLEIVYSDKPQMFQYGLKYNGDPYDNLCLKAYRLLSTSYKLPPVAIHLYKKIPVGAGLGGGSSDAAFTLMMLNRLFSLGIDREFLAGYANELGSDCSFFISNKPVMARGKGDVISPFDLDLSRYRIEIVNPGIFISTKEAYAGIVPAVPPVPLAEVLSRPVSEWKSLLANDFEKSIFTMYPRLADIKQSFYDRGAIYASMSGSGSSIYGIFARN